MVSTLFITAVVVVMVFGFAFLTLSERRSTGSHVQYAVALQAADGATERARVTLVEAHEASLFTVETFLSKLRGGELFGDVQPVDLSGVPARWEVRGVSPAGALNGWVDIAATAESPRGVQTVVRRVSFGQQPPLFHLALLSEKTECMFCHLRVRGDVGSFHHFRPGYGDETNGNGTWMTGSNSAYGSRVTGSLFGASTITKDATNLTSTPRLVNGAQFTGTIHENYRGPELLLKVAEDGTPVFPPVIREVAEANATGSARVSNGSSARLVRVPHGGVLPAAPTTSTHSSLEGTYDGNLVLIGTQDDPILLDGDIYVTGDVIVKGYVGGIGGIYAGRNVYIAGDLINPNPAPVCGNLTTEAQRNACARTAIDQKKDAVRIAARGNILLGDFTEFVQGTSGARLDYSQRQAAAFLAAQFGLYRSGGLHFDRRNGDELALVNGVFRNVDGVAVGSADRVNARGWDPFTYAIRPGRITPAGGFDSWLGDDTYRDILGTDRKDHTIWRYKGMDVPRPVLEQITAPYELSAESIETLYANRLSNDWNGTMRDESGNTVGHAQWSKGILSFLYEPEREILKQTNRVDAFLYANMRIAGTTLMDGLAINGGLIAKEVEILAPSRRMDPNWMPAERYSHLNNADACPAHPNRNHAYAYLDGCRLTINYDYRLRNGGYGFNLILGDVGGTLAWHVADQASKRVAAP